MILHDYEKFKIHPDRIMKIEKFIKRNNLDEKYMNKYQDTILQVYKSNNKNDFKITSAFKEEEDLEQDDKIDFDQVRESQQKINEEDIDYISHMYSIQTQEMINKEKHKQAIQGQQLLNRFVFKVIWKPQKDNNDFQQVACYYPGNILYEQCPKKLVEYFIMNLKE